LSFAYVCDMHILLSFLAWEAQQALSPAYAEVAANTATVIKASPLSFIMAGLCDKKAESATGNLECPPGGGDESYRSRIDCHRCGAAAPKVVRST
jgi:hypothetical protein